MSTDTQDGGQGTAGTFGAVREQAESLIHKGVDTINESATKVQENMRSAAQSYVDQAKGAAVGELQGAAQFVRSAIPSDNAPPIVSQYANQAADSLEHFAKSLQDQDLQSIIAGVNDFARRQPALFLGASVAVGFVMARFLRSRAPQSQTRYGAPASSLYPPQDFQHGHGATSPKLRGSPAEARHSSGGSAGHGGGGQESSVGQRVSRGQSASGQPQSGQFGGGGSASHGIGTGRGTGGGSSTQGGGGSGGAKGSSSGAAAATGGLSSGGSVDRSGSPTG